MIRATKDRHEWASTVADMSERYPLVYRLLIDAGHDPAKAVELLLDAKRGDEWALIWIRVLRRNRKVNVVSEGRRSSADGGEEQMFGAE